MIQDDVSKDKNVEEETDDLTSSDSEQHGVSCRMVELHISIEGEQRYAEDHYENAIYTEEPNDDTVQASLEGGKTIEKGTQTSKDGVKDV